MSGKGGVGKSMTSALLACAMARRGYHCGILDADITGPSIPKLFGIHGRAMADDKGCWPIQSRMGIDVMSINLLVENEEDPVVWRGPVIAGAVKQFWTDVVWKDVDFLFVDMPPGTGDVPLTDVYKRQGYAKAERRGGLFPERFYGIVKGRPLQPYSDQGGSTRPMPLSQPCAKRE